MRVLAVTLDDADPRTSATTVDRLKDKLKSAAIVLRRGERRQGVAMPACAGSHARVRGELGELSGAAVGRQGGGRPDMAQAGAPTRRAARRPAMVNRGGATRMRKLLRPWRRRCRLPQCASRLERVRQARTRLSLTARPGTATSTRTATCGSRTRRRLERGARAGPAHGAPRLEKGMLSTGRECGASRAMPTATSPKEMRAGAHHLEGKTLELR